MAWLILGLGIGLCGAGAAALWSGVAYMPVEWGWSQIIAGATAISGGVVTMGLAAIVHRLGALQNAMLARAMPRVDADEPAPDTDALTKTAVVAELPEAAVPVERAEPAPEPPGRTFSGASSAIVVPASVAEEPPAASNGHGRRVGVGDVVGLHVPSHEADAPDAASLADPPTRSDEHPHGLEVGGDAAAATLDGADGVAPSVVGRYDAGGASYALFSDGTIEVETETGIHRFASMDELKAYLERQDSAGQAGWPE